MILKCVKNMDKYKVGDKVTAAQLHGEGHPQFVVDYCFVAESEPKPSVVVKLAIVEVDGRLGCWVPSSDYELVLKEKADFTGSRRWLPLETIPGLASFSHWLDQGGAWTEGGVNGRLMVNTLLPAGWARFAVFAAKE